MRARAFVTFALGVAVGACDDETIHWIDPAISIGGDGVGPRGLTVGFVGASGDPASFVDLATAPTLVVVHGLQGGTWTMPTLRIDGPLPSVRVSCEVTTDAGEVVGSVASQSRTSPLGDGRVDIPYFPIPIRHAPPRSNDPIDDLDGVAVTLACEVAGGGGKANADYAVTLAVQ